jgi:trk system potassium uptake protein TrkH
MAGLYLSLAMLAPAAVDFYFGNPDWQVFAVSSFAVGAICLASAAANRGINAPFSRRLGFLVVNLLWITLSVTGAIPFYLASLGLDMADALFESVSAVTTTGPPSFPGSIRPLPGSCSGARCCNGSAESALSPSASSCCHT